MPTAKKQLKTEATKKKIEAKSGVLNLYDIDAKESGTVMLPKEIVSAKVNKQLLAQYVRVYMVNQRRGTASTKTRGEVDGSTRKIYRQKGTGKARHGDIKAPIFVGGGAVGGPLPKDFNLSMNKKQKSQALLDSLALQYKEKHMICLDDSFNKMEPKTKLIASFLKKMNLYDSKNLLVVASMKKNNLNKAAQNIEGLRVADVRTVNPYLVLTHTSLLFTKEALDIFTKHYLKQHEN